MASLTTSSLGEPQQEEQRKNKIIDSVQSPKVMADNNSNKQLDLSSPTRASSGETATAANGVSTNSMVMVVYDVEHLATFSTTGTCHETNNRSTNNGISGRSKNNNNKSNATATTTTTRALATSGNGENPTLNESPTSDDDNANNETTTTPKVALQRLFELEKLSGIWTQRMQIELRDDFMLIIDCETNSTVERFQKECVTRPEAFNQYNDIYNNIVVFIIEQQQSDENKQTTTGGEQEEINGEIHIFQCVSHKAQQLVSDILNWKNCENSIKMDTNKLEATGKQQKKILAAARLEREQISANFAPAGKSEFGRESEKRPEERNATTIGSNNSNANPKPVLVQVAAAAANSIAPGGASTAATNGTGGGSENVPIVNVNVKETVQVFNQIAALREKGKSSSPTNHKSVSEGTSASQSNHPASSSNGNGALDRVPAQLGTSQLYKQRSIRATLAPKFGADEFQAKDSDNRTKGSETGKATHITNNNSSCSSSDAAHSSSSTASYYNCSSSNQQRHRTEINHNRDSEQAKKAPGAGGAKSAHQVSSSSSPAQQQTNNHHKSNHKSAKPNQQQHQQQRTQSDSSRSFGSSSSQGQLNQVTTNESYVSVLNHCFDDIEKFIIRLQQAVAAIRELQTNRKLSKRSAQEAAGIGSGKQSNLDLAMLQSKARGPNEDDYFEILSKLKLAFNLLAKLKGCIHEPNAPELVHFLFTPLAIIIESARNALPPIDPTLVGIPYLNQDALDLLSNCCTSKESDLWVSLGPNWTQTIDMSLLKASRLPSSFQPIFSDGWAPIISELELIGLVAPQNDTHIVHNYNNNTKASVEHHQHADTRPTRAGYPIEAQPLTTSGKQASVDYMEQSHYATSGEQLPLSGGGKARRGSQQSSRHLMGQQNPPSTTNDPYQRPYQAPYGYMEGHLNAASMTGSEQSKHRQHRAAEGGQPSSRSSRSGARERTAGKQYNSQPGRHQQDYLPNSELSLVDHRYPNAPLGASSHHLIADGDTDLMHPHLLHQNNQTDDYTELQEHYAQMGRPRATSGGGSLHYRNGGEKLRNQLNSRPRYADHYNQSVTTRGGPYQRHNYETEYFNEVEHEAMLLDLGPAQTEWFYELQSRGALIVRVLFTREANNDKELSVARGEILEVLDDSRKWWRARNIDLQVAHVPHTIVAIMQGYQTLDELLANNPATEVALNDDPNLVIPNRFPVSNNLAQQQWHSGRVEDKRNSRNSGAFRYF